MAESEEFRLKRLKQKERLSRVFDKVMGLGDFADASRGSASSSRSGGQDETTGADKTSGAGEHQPVKEEEPNGGSKVEKTDKPMGESSIPHSSSPSTVPPSSVTVGTNERGGSGGAACDDTLDSLPVFGPEKEEKVEQEDDDDDDVEAIKEDCEFDNRLAPVLDGDEIPKKAVQARVGNNATPDKPSALQPREEEEEQEEEEEEEQEDDDDYLEDKRKDVEYAKNCIHAKKTNEDMHHKLPEDVDRANRGNSATPGKPSALQPIEEEEEKKQERGGSTDSANTSHSSKDHTPENSQGGSILTQVEDTEDSQEGEVGLWEDCHATAILKSLNRRLVILNTLSSSQRSEAAPMEDSNPPLSAPINIKDEPIDEGYDNALLPQSSIRQIKEELENQEEELRISSVYSVGGGNTFTSPTVPAAAQAPTQTAICIPGRGAVLQAMSLRPPAPLPLPALVTAPPRPPPPSVPGSVRCSGCSKVLLKGQTAFQRKGSTQLFCSTVCLTGHLPTAGKNKACFQCNREILQPRDMITIPGDNSTFINFCGQFCLSVFRQKKKPSDKIPDKTVENKAEKPPEKPAEQPPDRPICSVCRVSNRQIEHEVTHQGRLHKLCSDACFVTWRKMRHLAMNCCEGCGLYCSNSSGACQTLTIDRSQLNFCGPTCINTYKRDCRKTSECANCHKMAIVAFTFMERDQRGKVQLYCSSSCVERSRPPKHVLDGTAFPCCLCKVSAVPQYHLAMVDGTIRNFCSYDCVCTYRKSGIASQSDLINGASILRDAAKPASSVPPVPQDHPSSAPYQAPHHSHTSAPPLAPPYPAISSPSVPGKARPPAGKTLKPAEGDELTDVTKLTCHQCSKQFKVTPLLFSLQGQISMFCSKACCEQYKTQKNILIMCEFCKQEKVLFDTISYNQQDLIFCSESCKQLYKHELTSRNKDHSWRPCTYCTGVSQKMLHSHYGGKMEEFCRPHCMSQYTVLFYGMGRCDGCRKQGYMAEKLQCLGSVRNFCHLPCLLQYCFLHFETSQPPASSNGAGTAPQTPFAPAQPQHSSKMNPVIADVVSLANGSASQPSVSADAALTGALPTSNVDGKNLDHASTQTDAVPTPRRRQMKNKSVLCRPFTVDKESMCQLPAPCDNLTALRDGSSQPDQPSAEASTSPAAPAKPQGETQPRTGVPARLTGRHFLAMRETDSDCKVCSQHKRKKVEEEEQEEMKKKKRKTNTGEEEEEEEEPGRKTEEESEEAKEVNSCEGKEAELSEAKPCEQRGGAARRRTPYYCKTCSGEPSLCPAPCFELYHTRLIYKSAPQPDAQAS
ncbi:zinc finger MYM-type protein 4-like isoform X2 [Pseudoliparis swirei]|uniref:zinc finger MYM-type protein 4-like isoform X2 n=1 Tax=Pseudoliparis swirei TaxID=2059687 RepID=UPI0024BD86EB|nr:zinc finger MYM-type protein 4-like isoform X2 [Pseudoliparis swirei]